MASAEAVIFDIGNVLIEWQPERFYDAVMKAEDRARMFSEVDLHGMNDEIDRGGPFRETVEAWAARYPAWSAQILMWHDHWIEMAAPEIPHSVRLLRALRRRGVPVFALTNFGIGTFAVAEPRYPFLREFDRLFLSGRMGVTKPDQRIYEMVETDCAIPPDRLLFADDRKENTEAARLRGWQVHHFDGPAGWAERLVEAGLLLKEDAA